MRYVAAYLLASLGGSDSPSPKDILKVLNSVGIEAENDKIDKVISELKGKNIDDLIVEGSKKLASVPAGGGSAPVAAPASKTGSAPVSGGAPAKKEEKKEEKKKEESEESEDDMGFGLFD